MIAHYIVKVKEWCVEHKEDVFLASLIFLVGMAGFGLGRLSAIWPGKTPIRVLEQRIQSAAREEKTASEKKNQPAAVGSSRQEASYVASKQGSKYHFAWCPGALTIKGENKIWFDSAEQARAQGYQPAKNCPDLD